MKGYKIYCDCRGCKNNHIIFRRNIEIKPSIDGQNKLNLIVKGLLLKGNIILNKENVNYLIETLNRQLKELEWKKK